MQNLGRVRRHESYQESFERYGASPQALHYTDYRSAALRYRELVKGLDFDDKTVLDAGCGMGDLLPYLYARSDTFSYIGVDIEPAFINVAKKHYLGHDFRVADPFSGGMGKTTFDIVLSSGVMNANISGWMAKRQQMIRTLFELTKETLAFNMAGGLNPPANSPTSRVAYAKAADIVAFCKTLTPKVTLRSGYHSKDFTVVMSK